MGTRSPGREGVTTTRRRGSGPAAVALALFGFACAGAGTGTAQVRTPALLVQTGSLPDRVSESSGVAVSRRYPGVLWTHNDSGHDPLIFAVDSTGALEGTFDVRGAGARDWEDIALGPCPGAGDRSAGCLYLADTGNNTGGRDQVSIWIVREPRPPNGHPKRIRKTTRAHRLRIRYRVEHPVDVEALAITPEGDAYLISKGRHGPIDAYRIRAADISGHLDADAPLEVEPWGAAHLGLARPYTISSLVTGAAVSPDGSTLVVRTYLDLHFYRIGRGLEPAGAACRIGAVEGQGEAVDFLDADTLVLTSESLPGRPGSIHRIRC